MTNITITATNARPSSYVDSADARDDDDLTAEHLSDGWCACDTSAQRWWPHDDAQAEIEASDDPETAVLTMCRTQPMRGTWVD